MLALPCLCSWRALATAGPPITRDVLTPSALCSLVGLRPSFRLCIRCPAPPGHLWSHLRVHVRCWDLRSVLCAALALCGVPESPSSNRCPFRVCALPVCHPEAVPPDWTLCTDTDHLKCWLASSPQRKVGSHRPSRHDPGVPRAGTRASDSVLLRRLRAGHRASQAPTEPWAHIGARRALCCHPPGVSGSPSALVVSLRGHAAPVSDSLGGTSCLWEPGPSAMLLWSLLPQHCSPVSSCLRWAVHSRVAPHPDQEGAYRPCGTTGAKASPGGSEPFRNWVTRVMWPRVSHFFSSLLIF